MEGVDLEMRGRGQMLRWSQDTEDTLGKKVHSARDLLHDGQTQVLIRACRCNEKCHYEPNQAKPNETKPNHKCIHKQMLLNGESQTS